MDKQINRDEDAINALTRKIIGCAMEVHKALGNWFSGSYLPKGIGY